MSTKTPEVKREAFDAHILGADETVRRLKSDFKGLSEAEAAARLAADGHNVLEQDKKKSIVVLFLEQLKGAMTLILIAAAIISGIFSEFVDMSIILAVVIINAVMGVVQESKAEKAIDALKKLSAPHVNVLRGGKAKNIDAAELVRGDVILLEAGDTLAADVRLLESHSLKVEEAMLTGESEAVEKITERVQSASALGDMRNMAFMGTNVVYGRGTGIVTSTGMGTEMGKIARVLTETKEEKSPLAKQLDKVGRILSVLIISICVLIFLLKIFQANGIKAMENDELLHAFMLAVSLAVAAIPEGLLAVVTLVMTMGVIRMSKRNAIIRKLPAVETLGCAEIVCSDKTGTLTKNKMTVTALMYDDGVRKAGDRHGGRAYERVVSCMLLCNDTKISEGELMGDPTETALVDFAMAQGLTKDGEEARYKRVGEVPFDSARRLMTTINTEGTGYVAYMKGGADEVLARCTKILINGEVRPITDGDRKAILAKNTAMAKDALRVLAYAYRPVDKPVGEPRSEVVERDMIFVGCTGMIDPVRPEVADAVRRAQRAGIRPIMITGDHKVTAVAIGRELGLLQDDSQALSGAELDALSDREFDKILDKITVYARVSPKNKVRIVSAWKKRGKICAMTGDGVNDAPAIKTADIGVGMGITGTDVTKNVADIVLADDNFNTIIVAVEEGRKIYANIKKTVQFLLSTNMSEVLTLLIATLFLGKGIEILTAIQILWINLVTDTIPALGLGAEGADKDIMERPPRNPKSSLFSEGTGIGIAYQSMIMTALVFAAYFIGEATSHEAGMTMAFATLSLLQIAHSFNMKSTGSILGKRMFDNKWLSMGALLTTGLTMAVIYIPYVNTEIFSLVALSPANIACVFALSIAIIPIIELIKFGIKLVKKYRTKNPAIEDRAA